MVFVHRCTFAPQPISRALLHASILIQLPPETLTKGRTLTNVLFIAGWQRSGTTLLGDILGSYDKASHIGELTYLFTPTHPAGGLCGCGVPLVECPLWTDALKTSGLVDKSHLANRARLSASRMRHVPKMTLYWKHRRIRAPYSRFLSDLYPAIARASQADIVVDSSKTPGEALAAVTASGVSARILHLVRDPRGCAYSTSRRAKQHHSGSKRQMRVKSPHESSVRWLQVNGLIEGIKASLPKERSMTVRYEDLMKEPRDVIEDIADWAGLASDASPFTSSSTAELVTSHTVMGNPNRFSKRTVSLELDDEWRREMQLRDALAATLPAIPLIPRYGYHVLPFSQS